MASASINPKKAGNWNKDQIGREVNQELILDFSEDDNAIEEDIELNCLTKQIHFVVPALNGADTAEFILQDEDNHDIYRSGEKAESTTYILNVERALCGVTTVLIETSGAQLADTTFKYKIIYVV